jgi:hypothetical protein
VWLRRVFLGSIYGCWPVEASVLIGHAVISGPVWIEPLYISPPRIQNPPIVFSKLHFDH